MRGWLIAFFLISLFLLGILHLYPAQATNFFAFTGMTSAELAPWAIGVSIFFGSLLAIVGPSRNYLDDVRRVTQDARSAVLGLNLELDDLEQIFPLSDAKLLRKVERLKVAAEMLAAKVGDSHSILARAAQGELANIGQNLEETRQKIAQFTGENNPARVLERLETVADEIEQTVNELKNGRIENKLKEIQEFIAEFDENLPKIAERVSQLPTYEAKLNDFRERLRPLADEKLGTEVTLSRLKDLYNEVENTIVELDFDNLDTEAAELLEKIAELKVKIEPTLRQLEAVHQRSTGLGATIAHLREVQSA